MGSDPQQLEVLQPLNASPEVQISPQDHAPHEIAEAERSPVEPALEEPLAAASCISLEAEVPELLYEGMRQFITSHPQWDQYRLVTSALANFLFQKIGRAHV